MKDHKLKFNRRPKRVSAEDEVVSADALIVPETDPLDVPAELDMAAVEAKSELLTKLTEAIGEIQLKSDRVAEELGSLSVSLARVIVEKIIGESEKLKEKRLHSIIQSALGRPEPSVGVFVNSENLELVREFLSVEGQSVKFQLVADDSILPGECRVSFNTHELISDLESQLDSVEAKLREVLDDHIDLW